MLCMPFSDPVRETELVNVLRAPAPGQEREKSGRPVAWTHFILRALSLLLLAATVLLSSGAKNSGYARHHSTASYLSKITKMRETPIQCTDARPALRRLIDSPSAVAEADVSPPIAGLILAASPVLGAGQFRSPPADLL